VLHHFVAMSILEKKENILTECIEKAPTAYVVSTSSLVSIATSTALQLGAFGLDCYENGKAKSLNMRM